MANKYRISKEREDWIVSVAKTGIILAYFEHKHQAEDYRAEQNRADEQSKVMGDYNNVELSRVLAAEFALEFN